MRSSQGWVRPFTRTVGRPSALPELYGNPSGATNFLIACGESRFKPLIALEVGYRDGHLAPLVNVA
jgi:hypothetical protein